MFGEKIDYWLLRPLCHDRLRATEKELDEGARMATFTRADAVAHLHKLRELHFRGRLPVDPALSYLDVGCGMGRLAFGLLESGARDVTGVDIVPRRIAEAARIAQREGWDSHIKLECADVHHWSNSRSFDVITVIGALEHIRDPLPFLIRLAGLLKENGRAYASFEPFNSPIGDHLHDVFRVQIPWRGTLFSEKALLRLRREFFRPTDPATRFQDIVGGLNKMTYSEFLKHLKTAGLEIEYANFTPQLRQKCRPLYWASEVLCRIPRVRDFFIMMAYVVLRKTQRRLRRGSLRDTGSTRTCRGA
jgi:2-polyprenyl-3-methyl-5-hydroxy-6-metoxy-1,4-benzoquinol methylase